MFVIRGSLGKSVFQTSDHQQVRKHAVWQLEAAVTQDMVGVTESSQATEMLDMEVIKSYCMSQNGKIHLLS